MKIYPTRNIYAPLYEKLEDAGLISPAHVVSAIRERGIEAFSTKYAGWVDEFVADIVSNFEKILELHEGTEGQTMVHERLTEIDFEPFEPSGLTEGNPFEIAGRYGALFPGRVLFIGAAVITENDQARIQRSFLYQLLTLKPLLESGLALLLPSRIVDKSGTYNREVIGAYHHVKSPSHITFEGSRYSRAYFDRVSTDLSLDDARESRVLHTPAICGASLSDVAASALDNWEEYNSYFAAQSRFFRERPNSEEAIRDWIEDLDGKRKQLESRLKKKQKELTQKGIECFVGGLISAAPLLIPNFPPEAVAYIRNLMGAKTLYDAHQWFGQWKELRKELRPGSPWAVWKPTS